MLPVLLGLFVSFIGVTLLSLFIGLLLVMFVRRLNGCTLKRYSVACLDEASI